jgi:antitoxin component of RelBE/YafQ-DinJ toxin-antitoxin module
MPITDIILARADHSPKERAAAALADMGVSLSDAIRLLIVGAGERGFPLGSPPSQHDRGLCRLTGRSTGHGILKH